VPQLAGVVLARPVRSIDMVAVLAEGVPHRNQQPRCSGLNSGEAEGAQFGGIGDGAIAASRRDVRRDRRGGKQTGMLGK
jgi:hypothetical protein